MTNPWAPKSAYDEADEPLVQRARHLHTAIYAALFALGLLAGYFLMLVLDDGPGARIMRRYLTSDAVMAYGIVMVVAGGIFGELANALWMYLCRFRLGLSAEQAASAVRRPVVPSFVLGPLYERLYGRKA